MLAWGMSLSHRCIGKAGLQLESPAMKWFLKVLMALSTAFLQWMYNGASWKSTPLLIRYSISTREHSLSNLASCGVSPACLSFANASLCASKIAVSVLFFIGMLLIRLES